jgi:hypothetical protein
MQALVVSKQFTYKDIQVVLQIAQTSKKTAGRGLQNSFSCYSSNQVAKKKKKPKNLSKSFYQRVEI